MVKEANYGWPDCQGPCTNPIYTDPAFSYPHSRGSGGQASVTGGFVYRGQQFPEEFQGAYFFADFARGWIHYLTFDETAEGMPVTGEFDFAESKEAESIVFLGEGPEGALYYLDIVDNQVRRIAWRGNQAPVFTSFNASPTEGDAPLTVKFSAEATDDSGSELTYMWDFGDGNSANGQNVTHTYTEKGLFVAQLTVKDGKNESLSEPITISVGSPLEVSITSPIEAHPRQGAVLPRWLAWILGRPNIPTPACSKVPLFIIGLKLPIVQGILNLAMRPTRRRFWKCPRRPPVYLPPLCLFQGYN